jgi:hypothetical protein
MNRREFLGASAAAGVGLFAGIGCREMQSKPHTNELSAASELKVLPYPQQVELASGALPISGPIFVGTIQSKTIRFARQNLFGHLPSSAEKSMPARFGSIEEGFDAAWLTADEVAFLKATKTSDEASVLKIAADGITVVGKGKQGMLYGVSTINQMLIQAARENHNALPFVTIRDWPDLRWRCLAPTLTWYSGWNRLEGYDLCNWSEGEWKWLADWSLLHKCNAWAVCMYGYWPFSLPGHENETLDVESDWFNPETNKKDKHRFVHRNIRREFYGDVIRYANERGVKVHAYIGKNSFNGCAFKNDPKRYAGGAAEMLPFAPGVREYWDAFIGRILESGFNGFVFEDPESNHVPNQNEQCWKTFWEPWAKEYGFKSVADTNPNAPPLGVHIEYYAWLFRTFDELIQKHAKRLNRETPEIYLISHFLLARIVNESKTKEERDKWLAMVDEKQKRKVPFVIVEDKEAAYVEMFGGERVASLGGRGGSCTNAMRRIASVNNNWCAGGMGGDLIWERDAQTRIVKAGGFGAMAYIFEWTNTEVFGYLGAQYLWRNAGIPAINNTDQTGILYHAYKLYYGEEVGELAARVFDEGSCVNDAMVLEGVYGSQWPTTGKALHRDYQLLAVLADRVEPIAREAYKRFTGKDPELYQATYDQDQFKWNGYDAAGDKLFKTERLRLLWVQARRSQEMCETALAHRLAQRLMAEGAPREQVLAQYDRALEHAKLNQRIYQLNYDDDYDWTDGLCAKVTETLEAQRAAYEKATGEDAKKLAQAPVLYIPWEKQSDLPLEGEAPARLSSPKSAEPPSGDHTKRLGGSLALQFAIACTSNWDYYNLGVVFTVETSSDGSNWRPVFRRTVRRRERGWFPCEVSIAPGAKRIRFITDSYSRAMNRNEPTWKWALWGQPRLLRGDSVAYDFAKRAGDAHAFVRLDSDGKDRPFDHPGEDSTGATFKTTVENLPESFAPVPAIAAFTPHKDGNFGITIAEFEIA